VEIPKDSL